MPLAAASEKEGRKEVTWGHPKPRQEDCVPLLKL